MLDGAPGVRLRITRAGPQRRALQAEGWLQVRLDCDWVHVMPVRTG